MNSIQKTIVICTIVLSATAIFIVQMVLKEPSDQERFYNNRERTCQELESSPDDSNDYWKWVDNCL